MYLFAGVEFWLNYAVLLAMMVFRIWAVFDCATRKASAFPAVNKLTKPVWLAITIGSAALAGLMLLYNVAAPASPLNIISLVTLVASLVYLADVRPAVREVSGGSGQRW